MQRSSKEVEKFYKSKAWQKTRDSYIAYRNGKCERCASAGVIVHHKIYITTRNINNPEITLNFNNLELLCRKCHNQEHFKDKTDYNFDEDGNLISPSKLLIYQGLETDERAFKE